MNVTYDIFWIKVVEIQLLGIILCTVILYWQALITTLLLLGNTWIMPCRIGPEAFFSEYVLLYQLVCISIIEKPTYRGFTA